MLLRYAFVPFRGSPLLLTVCFTLGLMLAVRAGIAGIALAILLVSWFSKYCFVLLDALIAGADEPPVLSVEMVNPVSEQRPLAQAALIFGGVLLVGVVEKYVGHGVAVFVGACGLLMLPASIAVMGITSNPLRAAYPPSLVALVRGVGVDYVWLVAGALACGGALYFIARNGVPLWGLFAAAQWSFLTVFALIGGAVFEHRAALGIATRTRSERMEERDRRDHVRERRRVMDEAYAQLRLHRSRDSWEIIDRWLAPHRGQPSERDEYLAAFEIVSQWDDLAVADKLANEYITLLLARRDNGAALTIAERRLALNPAFHPQPAEQAARLAELASLAGKRALRRQLDGVR